MDARGVAIMCTVTSMMLVAFSLLLPWATLTRTYADGVGNEYSNEMSYYTTYSENEYGQIYRLEEVDEVGQVVAWMLVLAVAWLFAGTLFVRSCIGRSRAQALLLGATLLAIGLTVGLYFPIGIGLADLGSSSTSEVSVRVLPWLGWVVGASATVVQSIGVLQMMFLTERRRWDSELRSVPDLFVKDE